MNEQKLWIRGVFDRAAPEYGGKRSSFFGDFGKRLVEVSDVQRGMNVLDVATGKGAVLFPAAQKVGPTGHVMGIDISSKMITQVRMQLEANALSRSDVRRMDAEALQFKDDTFDAVFCGFALFFFPSLNKALSEFRRVLKPGGTLAVSTWGKKPELSAWVNTQAQKRGATGNLAVTPLFDELSLKEVLEARFEDVRIQAEATTFWHASSDEWWQSLWEHGTRARLEKLTASDLEKLKTEALKKAEQLSTDKGVPAHFQVLYGLARKGKIPCRSGE